MLSHPLEQVLALLVVQTRLTAKLLLGVKSIVGLLLASLAGSLGFGVGGIVVGSQVRR